MSRFYFETLVFSPLCYLWYNPKLDQNRISILESLHGKNIRLIFSLLFKRMSLSRHSMNLQKFIKIKGSAAVFMKLSVRHTIN